MRLRQSKEWLRKCNPRLEEWEKGMNGKGTAVDNYSAAALSVPSKWPNY